MDTVFREELVVAQLLKRFSSFCRNQNHYCLLCCACHCVVLSSLCCSVVIMLYCYCVALLLLVLSYVLIVCTVPLPPGVNPIAVDKYIISYFRPSGIFNEISWFLHSGLKLFCRQD